MDQALELDDEKALRLRLKEDLSDTNVLLGDYIRLRGISEGDIIYLKDDGSGTKTIVVGNGTPYEGINEYSHEGWDYKAYNMWVVNKVFRLHFEGEGAYLRSEEVRMAADIAAREGGA